MSDGEGPGRHVDAVDLDLVSRKQQQSTLGHGVCLCKAHFLLSKVRLERNMLGHFNKGTELKHPVPCLKYRTCVLANVSFFVSGFQVTHLQREDDDAGIQLLGDS